MVEATINKNISYFITASDNAPFHEKQPDHIHEAMSLGVPGNGSTVRGSGSMARRAVGTPRVEQWRKQEAKQGK